MATTRSKDAAKALGSVPQQLAELASLSTGQLAARHLELFGEPSRSRNKDYLRKRLAWRLQELAEGGLSEFTLSKIAALGDALPERWARRQAEPALPAAAAERPRDPRLPAAGTVLRRAFAGATHEVTIEQASFSYSGQTFASLSAVAKCISGTQVNGFAFFGLGAGRGTP